MHEALTPTQARVLEYIAQHITRRQRPPTRREVAQHFGWASDNAAETHIAELERRGHIALDSAVRSSGQSQRGAHSQRYVRVIRWPESVSPAIQLATSEV